MDDFPIMRIHFTLQVLTLSSSAKVILVPLALILVIYTPPPKHLSRMQVLVRIKIPSAFYEGEGTGHTNSTTRNIHAILRGRYIPRNMEGNVWCPQTRMETEKPDPELQIYEYHSSSVTYNVKSYARLVILPPT